MSALAALAPIGLDELDATLALRLRADRKYVVAVAALPPLLERLAPSHAVLEIDGRRAFTYDSVYFDTSALDAVRGHVQGRRRRFKARTRLYVETGVCAFEVKVRSGRGETVKHRIPHPVGEHGRLTPEARAFLAEHVEVPGALAAVLRTRYRRVTLAGPGERVTIDRDVVLGMARLGAEWAIVETKRERAGGLAEQELRRLGSRPVSLSKYVLGTGLTVLDAPPHDLRRVSRRYFTRA